MIVKLEKRFAEFRSEAGRRLIGTLVKYGDTAKLPGGIKERFMPGAFGDVAALDVILNGHHDRGRPLARTGGAGLVLEDSADALSMTATLPKTRDADDVLELVRTGVLRGLSLEFAAQSERMESATRVIERARLGGLAVVDRPAYPESGIEARARKPRIWVKGGIRYGGAAFCECLTGDCKRVLFRPVALEHLAAADAPDVLALVGRATEAVGSTDGGTLRFINKADRMVWELTAAGQASAAGGTLTDLSEAGVKVYGRPIIDEAASVFTEVDGVRIFDRAAVKSLLIKPILTEQSREGWDPIVIAAGLADPEQKRRRYLWL